MKDMAGAPVTRRKKRTPQQNKNAPVKKTRKARAGKPSGAVIVLSGATPLRRQKAAEVLAEELQLHLASVDLSAVVSKHARETEKNVNRVFDMANRHGSILFFDEADALFGKGTPLNDAGDRYANTDVSHLLQCIEHHQGLVILTTNGKSRIEEVFSPEKPVIVLGGTAKKKPSQKKASSAVKPKRRAAKKK
ncbi:MAG: hypothetical protein NTNFB01_00730 [Nitrospira sp.]|jgi:SpoVK/Ycf46/Vps4 family AAA+-type ATPase